jgi:hypothetical protein
MIDGQSRVLINQMIHFMKAESFKKFYSNNLIKNIQKRPFFTSGTNINIEYYNSDKEVETLIAFLEKYQLCNRFLNSSKSQKETFSKLINYFKSPETIGTCGNFKGLLRSTNEIIGLLDKHVQEAINGLTCEECVRLDEALVCYSNDCMYATVIMAISAIELRLHRLIKNLDNQRYEKHFEIATLGQIVSQLSENDDFADIKVLIPKKHIPLIQLLNQYRIFAVHPKNEKISPIIVDSMISLSFAFICDPDVSVYDDDELKCN